MFCIKCGEENNDTAVYCRKCGEPTGVEVETRVAVRSAADTEQEALAESENEVFSIGPTVKFVKLGYAATAVAALFIVALAAAFAGTLVSPWIGVIIGLSLFVVPAWFHFRTKLVRYTLTASRLEIDEGFVSRRTRSIPLARVQDVTVSTGVVQRLLGFGDLVIENANEDGGRVVLKGIDTPRRYADLVMSEMRRSERRGP